MKLINWLFRIYKRHPALQGLVLGVVLAHLVILGGAYLYWLVSLLNRWVA